MNGKFEKVMHQIIFISKIFIIVLKTQNETAFSFTALKPG